MSFFVLVLGNAGAAPAVDLLKLRDPVTCADLGEATPALRDELFALAAPEILPSVVPMRAAECLAERFGEDAEVQAAFVAWTADPARPGQVLLLLGRVDTLSPPLAVALVRGALVSPVPRVSEKAKGVAAASVVPAVRELATQP